MRLLLLGPLAACGPATSKSASTGDTGTTPTSPSASGSGDTAAPPGPPAELGDCAWLADPGPALAAEVRFSSEDGYLVPSGEGAEVTVFSDAAALEAWSDALGRPFEPALVDFATERAVGVAYRQNSTCGVSLAAVGAWGSPVAPRVEVRVEDLSHACATVCDAIGGLVVLVALPATAEPATCVRIAGGCDAGF